MSDYITPVMFTDPSGESGILATLISLAATNPILLGVLIVAAVAIVTVAVVEIADAIETAHSIKNKNNYYVYTLLDENEQVFYVGITNNPDRRRREHKRKYGPLIKMNYSKPMNEAQARVLETGLIIEHGLDRIIDISPNSDKLLRYNQRKSISNKRYPGSLIVNKLDSELRLIWEKLGGW